MIWFYSVRHAFDLNLCLSQSHRSNYWIPCISDIWVCRGMFRVYHYKYRMRKNETNNNNKNVNHFPLYRKKPTKTLWEEKSVSKQVNIHRFDRLPFNSIHSIALRVNNNKQTNDKPTTSWLFIVFFSLAFFCRLFFTFSAMPTNGLCVPCALSLKWCAQRVKKIWQRNEKKKTEWIINKLYRNQRETNTTTQNE